MYSDVKATSLTSSGVVFAGPARIKGMYAVCGASAGSITFRDGGASGTVLMTVATPADATATIDVIVPENGIRCETGIYCQISNATSVLTFYA